MLVTGAEGFIGSSLTERLLADGAEVRALVHYKPYGDKGWLAGREDDIDIQAGGGRKTPHEERWPRVLAMVDTLTAAGATVLHQSDNDGVPDHIVMADPEGNEFCVV